MAISRTTILTSGNDYWDALNHPPRDANYTVYAVNGDDDVYGYDGNDLLLGDYDPYGEDGPVGDGKDDLFGEGGNDKLYGDGNNDYLDGGAGADKLYGGTGVDTVAYSGPAGVTVTIGGVGSGGDAQGDIIGTDVENLRGTDLYGDSLIGSAAVNRLDGFGGSDVLKGLGGDDYADGGTGNDFLYGDADNDRLQGNLGDDHVFGGVGKDWLTGGQGTDWMTGGLHADTFAFGPGDAYPGALARDHITDFSRTQGDKIDLGAIDANGFEGPPNNEFTWIGKVSGTHAFTAGQLGYVTDSFGADTIVRGSTDADADFEFEIELDNVSFALADTDFFL